MCQRAAGSAFCAGAALWSSSPIVAAKLRGHLKEPILFTGPSWLCDLETALEDLTPTEQELVRAAALDSDGDFNPWLAMPAEQFVRQVTTPWLPDALANGALTAYLQPIVNARTESIVAFESLIRAQVSAELVTADRIIAAARAHGLMTEFDELARQAAVRDGAPQLLINESLFVNFAPAVISDPEACFASTWQMADEVGCDASRIVFEVVETEQFPEMAHLRRILDSLRSKGARVALDDLGAGKTALTYIQELKPNIVKIDRQLLPASPSDSNLSLIAAITDYAHLHGAQVVAEGIETEVQLAMVRDLGIDMGQGWLFGRPAAKAERSRRTPGASSLKAA